MEKGKVGRGRGTIKRKGMSRSPLTVFTPPIGSERRAGRASAEARVAEH